MDTASAPGTGEWKDGQVMQCREQGKCRLGKFGGELDSDELVKQMRWEASEAEGSELRLMIQTSHPL